MACVGISLQQSIGCRWGAHAQWELALAPVDYELLLLLSILTGDLLGDLGQAYLISQHGISAGVNKTCYCLILVA